MTASQEFLQEPPADLEITQLPLLMPIHFSPKAAFADPNPSVHQPDMSQANTQQKARNALRVTQVGGF
ncbi:MAG: hypothetical protein M3Y13_14475 [Armatimonadota bacterium]|nr:hypothetical protein [Armatimonadota bacterium]